MGVAGGEQGGCGRRRARWVWQEESKVGVAGGEQGEYGIHSPKARKIKQMQKVSATGHDRHKTS